ncbi:peamaclein-like isoform X2 [Impatiens glandulifera]|uniref:peamaclein-like isoform X2 n=1 Tax=Impatiens glandulifera TaxID=253017 RepID=UPI001FB1161F|nr:peamaclein-like isoform X2 [Impatiens glandulifera]
MAMIIISCRFLVISLMIASSFMYIVVDDAFCDPKCKVRCSKAGRMDRCLEYCGICCRDCHCVPSGTFGNKDECPCYRDKKNSKGQSKCP